MRIAGNHSWISSIVILEPIITIEVQVSATRCMIGVESMTSRNIVTDDFSEVHILGVCDMASEVVHHCRGKSAARHIFLSSLIREACLIPCSFYDIRLLG